MFKLNPKANKIRSKSVCVRTAFLHDVQEKFMPVLLSC